MHSIIPFSDSIHHIVLSLLQQAEHTTEPRAAAKFSRLARKYGIISILTWVVILALVPPLMALVSFLLTLSDWATVENQWSGLSDFGCLWRLTTQSCFFTATKAHKQMKKVVVTWNNKDCLVFLWCCPRILFPLLLLIFTFYYIRNYHYTKWY